MTKNANSKAGEAGDEHAESLPLSLECEVRVMIQQARTQVARTVNLTIVVLYWNLGTRIRTAILQNKRADYGKQICSTLSSKFTSEFGKGFSRPNLGK